LYEALPFSVSAHAIAFAGAILGTVWQVEFPRHSPAQFIAFSVTELPAPPPPPPPPPPASARASEVVENLPISRPLSREEILAPAVIPEVVPQAVTEVIQTAAEGYDAETAAGVEGGMDGGVVGGELGGVLGGVIGGIIDDHRVRVARDEPLPMIALSQVYPEYPERARLHYMEDELVVRYVIGKDGRVKEVIVLTPPKSELFAESTLKAIRKWRFRPMVRGGERREVVHELTVYYRLVPARS
jgi:protein TonB